MQELKQIRSREGNTQIEKRDSKTRKRVSNTGFKKPYFKIGVSKTKVEHRGMKNEVWQVGYQKPVSRGGVLKTKVDLWVHKTKVQSRGAMIQSKGKG